MKINIEIPEYDGNAVDIVWEEHSQYSLSVEEDTIVLSANREGLISIAKQLLYLAYNDLPTGSHVHYSSFFCGNIKSDYELAISNIDR